MKLSELAKEEMGAKIVGGDAEIASLCTDSRVAGEGDLFFCFRGGHADSHEFAAEAEERGVAAIVCERLPEVSVPCLVVPDGRSAMARLSAAFYGHPERALTLAGVTGTNGKTTVTHMLCEIMERAGKAVGRIGTLGARYKNVTVAPALTTPDPVSLFSLLSDMRKAGVETVVMEVSAHALALRKTEPIVYDLAVFTNLTQDHLDDFGDMRAYGDAKRLLFRPEKCKAAVLNADDPFSKGLAEGVPAVTYGLDTPSDCFALVERETLRSTEILLNLEDELIETTLAMTGRYNVLNALAAAAAARKLGAPPEAIGEGLARTRVEGRLEYVGSHRGGDIFVDFAHTPDGIEKSLGALRAHCEGKLVVLFGCGGNRDRSKRPLMGIAAARSADFAFLTSDNPRFEDPAAVIAEIEAGFRTVSDAYIAVEDREEATRLAVSRLGKGDVLLVAGKGAENEQEIMGIKYAYNDKAVIKSLLEKDRDA